MSSRFYNYLNSLFSYSIYFRCTFYWISLRDESGLRCRSFSFNHDSKSMCFITKTCYGLHRTSYNLQHSLTFLWHRVCLGRMWISQCYNTRKVYVLISWLRRERIYTKKFRYRFTSKDISNIYVKKTLLILLFLYKDQCTIYYSNFEFYKVYFVLNMAITSINISLLLSIIWSCYAL